MTLLDGIIVYQWLADNHLWTSDIQKRFKETSDRTANLALEVWMLSMIPCPLLDSETKACMAYQARPFVCRIAFSHNEYFCHPHRFMEAMEAAPYEPRKVSLLALAKMEEALLKKHRLPRVVLPFATAVLHGEAICTTKADYMDRAKLIWLKELRGD